MIVAGIDYSMTSPAICVHEGAHWSLDNCKFYFLTDKTKLETETEMFSGKLHQEFTSQEQRFDFNAMWVLECLVKNKPSLVLIEGYAMGAKGKVFHIGENTGLMKHYLWKMGYEFYTETPTQIKKKACGKGNATKEMLEAAFVAETGFDLRTRLDVSAKSFNPTSDIIDAYYMAKIAFERASTKDL